MVGRLSTGRRSLAVASRGAGLSLSWRADGVGSAAGAVRLRARFSAFTSGLSPRRQSPTKDGEHPINLAMLRSVIFASSGSSTAMLAA